MASAATYTEELICSVCLSLFADPVSLSCGHSFCRECFNRVRDENLCPICRAPLRNPSTNYSLKSLAEKAKKEPTEPKRKQPLMDKGGSDWLCLDHEEKLKLFCETDQQLICVICRDGEKHDGHRFKPIKEAASARRRELDVAIQFLTSENGSMKILTNQQEEEIIKTKTKCLELSNQISTQFEEMHQFLRKREDEIKKDLKEKERLALENMRENLEHIEDMVSERKETEVRLRSAQDIADSESFLHWWNDRGLSELAGLKEVDGGSPPAVWNMSETHMMHPYRSRVGDLKVRPDSVSLGPYESHLQFFVWKEMLKVVKRLPERLTLETGYRALNVFNDGRSVMSNSDPPSGGAATCRSGFSAGQHCWEVEVGVGNDWEVGVVSDTTRNKIRFKFIHGFSKSEGRSPVCLTYCDNKYAIRNTEVTMKYKPRNILIYLHFPTMQLTFYNANSMDLIHITCFDVNTVCPYFKIGSSNGMNPLTVCQY